MADVKSLELKPLTSEETEINLYGDVDKELLKSFSEKIHKSKEAFDNYVKESKNILNEIVENPSTFDLKMPTLKINLSTFGGSCVDGFGIYDLIKNFPYRTIVHCNGYIMSMGIIIMLAADKRYTLPNTTFMIHQLMTFNIGKFQDMVEDLEESKRINDLLFKIIMDNTKITKEKIDEIITKKKDWWITAEQAKELGLVDDIIKEII